MYTAVCYNGNTGFGWIAVSQSVILVCSLVFLTLRVAFYEMVDESELQPTTGDCRCRVRFGRGFVWLVGRCTRHEETTKPAIDIDSAVKEALEVVATEKMDESTGKINGSPMSEFAKDEAVHRGADHPNVRITSRSVFAGSFSSISL